MEAGTIPGRRVLMVIAPTDFRDEEYREPRAVLEAGGATVSVASRDLREARGMLGGRVKPNLALGSARAADYDAVVFVGGNGASCYWNDPAAHALAREAAQAGKLLGAICVAPVTLANAGLLQGRRATVYPSEGGKLAAKGAKYTGQAVETDGRLVTANGPQSARAFGEALVKVLAEN